MLHIVKERFVVTKWVKIIELTVIAREGKNKNTKKKLERLRRDKNRSKSMLRETKGERKKEKRKQTTHEKREKENSDNYAALNNPNKRQSLCNV